MEASLFNLGEALRAPTASKRVERFLSSSMYVGQAMFQAIEAGDLKLAKEAAALEREIRKLAVECLAGKKRAKRTTRKKPKQNTAAIKSAFMRL